MIYLKYIKDDSCITSAELHFYLAL